MYAVLITKIEINYGLRSLLITILDFETYILFKQDLFQFIGDCFLYCGALLTCIYVVGPLLKIAKDVVPTSLYTQYCKGFHTPSLSSVNWVNIKNLSTRISYVLRLPNKLAD